MVALHGWVSKVLRHTENNRISVITPDYWHWLSLSLVSFTKILGSHSWDWSSWRERYSTMPAPREWPSTLTAVRRWSLQKTMTHSGADPVMFLFCMTATETLSSFFLEPASLVCDSALCIDNLCGGGTCEALWRFPVTFRYLSTQTPIPIMLTFNGNSQEPVHGNDQSYVLPGQSHRCQYDHHGNQASLRDACCFDAGSSCRDTVSAGVGGVWWGVMKRNEINNSVLKKRVTVVKSLIISLLASFVGQKVQRWGYLMVRIWPKLSAMPLSWAIKMAATAT